MKTQQIWVGRMGAKNGFDNSDFVVVEFTGEQLGYWRHSEDVWGNRGADYRIFSTEDGRILIHLIHWSRWQGEDTFANILEFLSLKDAIKAGWRKVLENAGAIPRRVASLKKWREWRRGQNADVE